MKINIDDYNRVIDGLRTQLQLQRRLTEEKNNILKSARALIDQLHSDGRRSVVRFGERALEFEGKINRLSAQLNEIFLVAGGEEEMGRPLTPLDVNWTAAYDRVYRLWIDRLEQKKSRRRK